MKTKIALGLAILFLISMVCVSGAQALEQGDLLVGAAIPLDSFGSTSGVIKLIRGGNVTIFCQSPSSGFDPNFWNTPGEVIVNSQGHVVFLAPMVSGNANYPAYGLFRCTSAGATPELLAYFPGTTGQDLTGRPVPFPGEYYEKVYGLHLARERRIVIDDDVNGGTPQITTEDAYVFAVATYNPEYPPQRTDVKSLKYLPSSGRWEEGPGPIMEYLTGIDTAMPDMTNHSGDTYVTVHPGRLPDGRGLGEVIRRIRAPFQLNFSGQVGGTGFELRLDIFAGHRDIGGGVGQGSFSEIAATSFVVDDLTVPNPTECPPDVFPSIDHSVPRSTGGGYNGLASLGEIVYDPDHRLTVTSSSIATGTPYVTQIDLAGLNDDPGDDMSQYFLRPELGCIPQRSIKFMPILPFFDPGGAGGNGVDRLVSATNGMFGTQRFDGEVVKVVQGDKVQTVASGLVNPVGIGAYPPNVSPGTGIVAVIRIDSPVNVLVTSPDGRRIGVDADGNPVNEFGEDGFDSGAGEPRFYAMRNPGVGDYLLDIVGTGSGPYTVHVYTADLTLPEGHHESKSGTVEPGSRGFHDFSIADDGTVAFGGPAPVPCDVDGDGDIDINDVNAIMAARGTAADAGDPRDANGDGVITVGDGRYCVTQCTKPRCAP